MTKITGGNRPNVDAAAQNPSAEKTAKSAGGQAATTENKVLDSFVRAGLPQRLEQMAGQKAVLGPQQFSNQQLAEVAHQFAVMLRKTPNADRKERAKMFAKAILGSKRFKQIFSDADENDLEKLYDSIAEQLGSSPKLAELVDEVTDWSLRSPIGR